MAIEVLKVRDAKSNLSRLLRVVEAGGEVVIARNGQPVARLSRYESPEQRLGVLVGEMTVPDDFDEPLPEDILVAFEGRT